MLQPIWRQVFWPAGRIFTCLALFLLCSLELVLGQALAPGQPAAQPAPAPQPASQPAPDPARQGAAGQGAAAEDPPLPSATDLAPVLPSPNAGAGYRNGQAAGEQKALAPSAWEERYPNGHFLGGMGSTYGVPPNSNAMVGSSPPRQPTLRISIISTAKDRQRTMEVATLLQDHQRMVLQRRIGMQVDVVRIITKRRAPPADTIRYQPGFLRAALQLSRVIPGQQLVEVLRGKTLVQARASRGKVDVQVFLRWPEGKQAAAKSNAKAAL